jgi:hypothetical protein
MSIGDSGRPTLVIALKPSVTNSTRHPVADAGVHGIERNYRRAAV